MIRFVLPISDSLVGSPMQVERRNSVYGGEFEARCAAAVAVYFGGRRARVERYARRAGATVGALAALFKTLGPLRAAAGEHEPQDRLAVKFESRVRHSPLRCCARGVALRNFIARRLIWPRSVNRHPPRTAGEGDQDRGTYAGRLRAVPPCRHCRVISTSLVSAGRSPDNEADRRHQRSDTRGRSRCSGRRHDGEHGRRQEAAEPAVADMVGSDTPL